MRLKIYTLIIVLSFFVIGLSLYTSENSIQDLKSQKAHFLYNSRLKEYKVYLEDKKVFLNTFAKFISSSKIVQEAYIKDDRDMLINFVLPLYKNLHKSNFIEEIHFFKRPAISFVNFANLDNWDFSVAKARADILWINTSFTPSDHFYICRLYPGLRATYPIIYKDKLLGSVSFGIHIREFKKIFHKLGAMDVTLYLNNKELEKMLLPRKYSFYSKLKDYNGYKVMGNNFDITLTPGYEIKGNYVYSKIKIVDFFNKTMAYLVIKDDMNNSMKILNKTLTHKTEIETLGFLFVFILLFILFKWMFDKMDMMKKILENIKYKKFNEIPKHYNAKDELDVYINNLIDVGNSIKAYVKLLQNKVDEYSLKAYKDGLTNIFNRRFLEEEAESLFIKYTLKNISVGVIMLDIDDFKKINDTYGHDVGDIVLVNLSQTISEIIRENDFFIRYGGEEFVLILPNSDITNTFKIAEKIRIAISNLSIDLGDKHINFKISLGIAEINSRDETLYDTIKRADKNLYKAKNSGKNKIEI